jgi:DNA polymerase II small subunit
VAAGLREHLVTYFEEHHKLLEAGALRLLLGAPQPLVVSQELLERSGPASPFVTEEMVARVLADLRPLGPVRVTVPPTLERGEAAGPAGSPEAPGFRVIVEGFDRALAPGPPIAGYCTLFQSRFRSLQRLLRTRSTLPGVRPIREGRPPEGSGSVIGLVREVRETSRQHHQIVTLDDETGTLEVLVLKDSAPASSPFLPDEAVGLRLRWSQDPQRLPTAITVERPDVPLGRAAARAGRPRRAVFLSDLHIGSKAFLAPAWERLVSFLRGEGPTPELAAAVDYVVIAGDLVDGIGVYPRQERDLALGDVVEQYAELGRRLAELPDRLTIVAVPGNHDAVCPAEPQPALPPNLARALPRNVKPLANPSTFSLAGVTVTAYHGRGFDDLIPALPGASYARPTEVMRRMLQMRHLAPIYGNRTPLAPMARDGLVVDPIPEILVTGHLHTYGVDRYRGVLLLNASTWQDETEYQRMRNITAVPARAAVVDLASLEVATLDCSGERATVRAEAA